MRKIIVVAMLVPFATACASINSSSYSNHRVADGILYKLPEKVYTATVTYSLDSCNPGLLPTNANWGTAGSVVKMSTQDLTIASSLVPSTAEEDWYFINPAALNSVFSSIDPATIELNQGMLTKVGLKSKGTMTDVVKLAASVARVFDSLPTTVNCTPGARDALKTKGEIDDQIAALKKAISAIETAAPASLTEDQARLLERLDGQLAAAKARKAKHVEEELTKTVAVLYRPKRDADSYSAAPPSEAFGGWFGTSITEGWLGSNAAIEFALKDPVKTGNTAAVPSRGFGYKGVYYRRPAVADLSASYTSGGITTVHTLRGERIPQLGTLARVAVEGTVLGSRGVALEFDADGDLKKYEMSSGSILTDAESAAGAIATAAEGTDTSELEKLTEEVDILKKKKERIDAKAALDAAAPSPE
jgi:hypothetical protein